MRVLINVSTGLSIKTSLRSLYAAAKFAAAKVMMMIAGSDIVCPWLVGCGFIITGCCDVYTFKIGY